eukprot:gnl/TRDRNA2_/TRDRNA2_118452_c1_seq2.p1 gnl/TRDRNA2_/TRDRNA2_118452_c1~~gnl/TRDRNA2_/TRDRNA2_118452_c1_seq2.p1  ORF type:complete len:169 (+),score=12.84 gnl/TRDRNA2_/TRDRNA2_118452_c1_seq2:48-554(+)
MVLAYAITETVVEKLPPGPSEPPQNTTRTNLGFIHEVTNYRRIFNVTTMDLARWMKQNFEQHDIIWMSLDIEGAEYEIIRHLIVNGVACWIDRLIFEGHAMYFREMHKFRAVDVVLPWLLSACGVEVQLVRYYCTDTTACDQHIEQAWKVNTTAEHSCKSCALLDVPI